MIMRKFLFLLLMSCAAVCSAQTNIVNVAGGTLDDVGTMEQGVSWFLDGLVWGSGIAALLFGFQSVRRALSMGDAWND